MMAKRFGVFLVLMVFFSSNVYASLGVTPAIYEIDFKPGLKQVFNFNFITEADKKLEIYVEGDLSKYAKLSTDYLEGGGNVKVLLQFPKEVEKPGLHKIIVGAKQLIEEGEGVGAAINIRAIIKVRVPYPGKYLDLDFSASSANAGDPIDFKLKIYSRGKESVAANSYIEIYDSDNKKADTLYLGTNLIEPAKSIEISEKWDTKGFAPGKYRATAIAEYDGNEAKKEEVFRIGELYVDIINYTEEFERDKINKMEIYLESFWNDPIKDVFANVSIPEYGISFLTPSTNLKGFGRAVLTGHFDTTPIKERKFKAKITLNYEGGKTEKTVNLRFKREPGYILIYAPVIGAVIAIAFAFAMLWIKKRKKKHPS